MGCAKATITSRFTAVWTDGSTNNLNHVLTEPMLSDGVVKVRPTFELRQLTPNIECRAVLWYSDDGETWSSPQHFALDGATYPFKSSEGHHYGSDFVDVTTGSYTRKRFVRFGIRCRNSTGTEIEFANARLQLDFEE